MKTRPVSGWVGLGLLIAALMLIYPAYVFDRFSSTLMAVGIVTAFRGGVLVGRTG